MSGDNASLLQHPRRNLGNRYRSQAQKFARLAAKDEARFAENMAWAEQNARQALLHDFTEEQNWRCLADLKLILGDSEGLESRILDLNPLTRDEWDCCSSTSRSSTTFNHFSCVYRPL